MKFIEAKLNGLFHDRFPYISIQYEIPILRKLMYASLIFLLLGMVFQVIYICDHWDLYIAIQNGFMLIVCLVTVQLAHITLNIKQTITPVSEIKKRLWNVNDAGRKLQMRIKNSIRLLQYIRIILTVLITWSNAFVIPMTGDIREVFGFLYLFESITTKIWYNYVYYGCKIYQVCMSISFPNTCCLFFYCVGDYIYAVMVMREKLQLLKRTSHNVDLNMLHDAQYQTHVKEVLTKCIEQHILIKQYFKLFANIFKDSLVPCFVSFVALLALFYCNLQMIMNTTVLLKSITFILLIALTAYYYAFYGQALETECENLYLELCECDWFLWNKSNKGLYMMFLVHTREPLIFSSSFMSVNFKGIVKIGRASMSTLTAIRQLIDV